MQLTELSGKGTVVYGNARGIAEPGTVKAYQRLALKRHSGDELGDARAEHCIERAKQYRER